MTHEQDVLFMTYASEFFSLYAGSETADVYELDPLICPRCGSEMKLIAVITDPSEVRKILRHLVKIGRLPRGIDSSPLI